MRDSVQLGKQEERRIPEQILGKTWLVTKLLPQVPMRKMLLGRFVALWALPGQIIVLLMFASSRRYSGTCV